MGSSGGGLLFVLVPLSAVLEGDWRTEKSNGDKIFVTGRDIGRVPPNNMKIVVLANADQVGSSTKEAHDLNDFFGTKYKHEFLFFIMNLVQIN